MRQESKIRTPWRIVARLTMAAGMLVVSSSISVGGEPGRGLGKLARGLGHVLDGKIQRLADRSGLAPLVPPPVQGDETDSQFAAKVELGRALFFDRLLSGNRDTSCATCHHPQFATGDALALSVGAGTDTPGLVGPMRGLGAGRSLVPRNAPEVFNRGDLLWTSMFWDSRVAPASEGDPGSGGGFISPAAGDLPDGLESVLAVQAMFPVTSRDEMRGSLADAADASRDNELAAVGDADLAEMWSRLMVRVMDSPEYRLMFQDAYGKTDGELDGLGFEFAANAIAAFEATDFTFLDSPWDQYLAGNVDALTIKQKFGALLFMTKGRCIECHNGPLLTDQQHYNIAVPPLGPGKDPEAPEDFGRFRETGDPEDLYRFRTPPLRNVAATGPWMHNGAYNSLRAAIKHHARPKASLYSYNPKRHLDQAEAAEQVVRDRSILKSIADRSDLRRIRLSNREIDCLVDFMETLTAPNLEQRLLDTVPDTVPSGLAVEGAP